MSDRIEQTDNGEQRLQTEELSSDAILVEKNGLLVARVQPLTDLTNITRIEREHRLSELLQNK